MRGVTESPRTKPAVTARHIAGIRTLEYLELELSDLKSRDFASLASLPRLRTLIVKQSHMTDNALKSVKRFPSLKELQLLLDYNISNKGISHLAGTRLERLTLGCPKITCAVLPALRELAKLKVLTVTKNTKITFQDCYALQEELGCRVRFQSYNRRAPKPLPKALQTEADLVDMWQTWLKTPKAKQNAFLKRLPPFAGWGQAFIDLLCARLSQRPAPKETIAAIEMLSTRAFYHDAPDGLVVQVDALVRLLDLTRGDIRLRVYLGINELLPGEGIGGRGPKWFNALLAQEKDRQVYWDVLMSHSPGRGDTSLLIRHIIGIGRARVKPGLSQARTEEVKATARRYVRQRVCEDCGRVMKKGEAYQGQCPECRSERWHDNFTSQADYSDRMFEEQEREKKKV